MRKSILMTVVITTLSAPAIAEEAKESRYVISNGVLQGTTPTPPPVTILTDKVSGATWWLVVVDGKMKWMPIQYEQKNYQDALPPMIQ